MEINTDIDRRIWLVRHGESTWNSLGLVQGHTDEPSLTTEGLQQAGTVAEALRESGIRAVYSSDLRRAQQTAEIIGTALELPVGTDRNLRERSYGVFEGQTLSSLSPSVTGIEGDQVVDVHARPERGESIDDLYRRAGTFARWLGEQQLSGDVVVVAHGGSIRALRAFCSGIGVEDMDWDVVSNGSMWIVPYPPVAVHH